MSYSDFEMKSQALNMWANYIETGNVSLSAIDVKRQIDAGCNQRPSFSRKPKLEINALSEEQMELVLRLRKMSRGEGQGNPELMNRALNMWANYIETGNVSLSATDAKRQIDAGCNDRDSFPPKPKLEIKALSEEQMELVLRLRKSAREELMR